VSQEQQFFSIVHPFLVGVEPLAPGATLPSEAEFEAMIPMPFKLAAHINHLDTQSLRPLRNLGENAHDLAEFLNFQSKKIDLMMSYILTLGAESQQRLPGTSFGGSNVTYQAPQAIALGQLVQLKIFIEENNCATFCIGRIIDCVAGQHHFIIDIEIMLINAEDQEQLVRTSLHVQSLQLKERAQLRKAHTSDNQDNPRVNND